MGGILVAVYGHDHGGERPTWWRLISRGGGGFLFGCWRESELEGGITAGM